MNWDFADRLWQISMFEDDLLPIASHAALFGGIETGVRSSGCRLTRACRWYLSSRRLDLAWYCPMHFAQDAKWLRAAWSFLVSPVRSAIPRRLPLASLAPDRPSEPRGCPS